MDFKKINAKIDDQIQLEKDIIDELVAIKNILKEFNSKPLKHNIDLLGEFIADNEELIYNKYCEVEPEYVNSDKTIEDIPEIDKFTIDYLEDELLNYVINY